MLVDGKEYKFVIGEKDYLCAMDVTMDFIGGKWKTIVLWYLKDDILRFGELRKRIPQISEKMLSQQLKALEKDGLVTRKVYPQIPPKVEYFLTEEGKSLIPLLQELAKWGRNKGNKAGNLVLVNRIKS